MGRVRRVDATVVVAALLVMMTATATAACSVAKPATGPPSSVPVASATAAATPTTQTPPSPASVPDSSPPKEVGKATGVATVPQHDNRPYGQPFAIAFPTASRGALIAMWCDPQHGDCRVFTKATADGGRTWSGPHTIESTPWPASGSTPGPWDLGVSQLAFTNANDGYAYGPHLFVTHDGGTTWTRIDTQDPVIELDATTQPPLVLEGRGCDAGLWCADTYVSTLTADQIARTRPQPPFPATQLVRVDDRMAYASTSNSLAITRDAGSTWATVPLPKGGCVTDLSATGPNSLWLVCGNDGAAGTMRKQLWRSDDAGATWRGPKELEYLGYANHIVADSKDVAWRFGARAGLFHTTDGGESWHPEISRTYGEGGGAPSGFAVAGPDNAWILDHTGGRSSTFTLRMTRDAGRTWRSVVLALPPSPTAIPAQ